MFSFTIKLFSYFLLSYIFLWINFKCIVTNASIPLSISHIIYVSHEDMKWSFVVKPIVIYIYVFLILYSSMLLAFISPLLMHEKPISFPTPLHSIPVFLPPGYVCIYLMYEKNSCCHCCPCTLLFECLLLYASPKLWKLKNLCAWTTFFLPAKVHTL